MINCSKVHFSADNQLVGGHSDFGDLVLNWPHQFVFGGNVFLHVLDLYVECVLPGLVLRNQRMTLCKGSMSCMVWVLELHSS